MSKFYLNKIAEIIRDIQYATLATVSASKEPYNAPVFVAYDEKLNLYWSSSIQSQHSKNIASNSKVYMVIYNSTVAQGTGWGVYIKAEATAVENADEAERALALLGKRRGKPFSKKGSDMINGTHKIYKAVPIDIWINDAKQDAGGEYVEDYRVAVSIKKVMKALENGT
jgi:nitroimidazol reductase NimA-like FMN-containing flavoprotein (pyridoxamine 5'-phosphate oxidase superfamily)